MSRSENWPWTETGYADIISATRNDGEIHVAFRNGDLVALSPGRLGISGSDFRLEVDSEEGLSVRVIDALGDEWEIGWAQVRALSDSTFAQELRRQDEEEARRIGRRLKALREDRNVSQRDLADAVGMSAPQLSKIENGAFDLRLSTVRALLRAMGATFNDIASEDAPEVSLSGLRKFAKRSGVGPDLIDLLFGSLERNLRVSLANRALGWQRDELIAGTPRTPDVPVQVAFKRTRSNDEASLPFVRLAYEVCALAMRHSTKPSYKGMPSNPDDIREAVGDVHGKVTYEGLLEWAWNAGVAVIPLQGRGGFAAAALSVEDEPAIVLKESRDLAVFWLFDLAHEIGHVACGHVAKQDVVDVDSPSLQDIGDEEETEATEFALELLVPDYRGLLAAVRKEARGSHLRFKSAVEMVANRAKVNAGMLGMVAAFSLVEIGEPKDRWGSATNIARADGSGRDPAVTIARRLVDVAGLTGLDAHLLSVVTRSTSTQN